MRILLMTMLLTQINNFSIAESNPTVSKPQTPSSSASTQSHNEEIVPGIAKPRDTSHGGYGKPLKPYRLSEPKPAPKANESVSQSRPLTVVSPGEDKPSPLVDLTINGEYATDCAPLKEPIFTLNMEYTHSVESITIMNGEVQWYIRAYTSKDCDGIGIPLRRWEGKINGSDGKYKMVVEPHLSSEELEPQSVIIKENELQFMDRQTKLKKVTPKN